jgi:FtsH-binding integral membrane protein
MSQSVQSRLARTYGYFGYGVAATGGLTYALRNSPIGMRLHWALGLAGTIGAMMLTMSLDYETQAPLKMAGYSAFIGMNVLTILPLI